VLGLVLAALACQPAAPAPSTPSAPTSAPSTPSGAPAAKPPAASSPTPQALPIRVAYSVRSGSQAIVQVLLDGGVFAANGLDATLLYTEGPARVVPALVTGEVDVALMGGEPALFAAIEGAELLVVGGLVNRREHVVFAVPAIQTVADLQGKRVAINGFQAADHQALLDALRYYGVDPQGVTFLVVGGGQPNRLAAVEAGAADATALQPPLTVQARAAGLRELLQVGAVVDRPVPNTAVVTSRATAAARPEEIRRFLRALAQGIALYRAQPEIAARGIAAFFGLDLAESRADVEETRAHYAALYADPPAPPVEGYRLLLEETAETNPRAAGFRLDSAVDDRFVRESAAATAR
jgi:NitT/TauT family transport system substrate-binding protein